MKKIFLAALLSAACFTANAQTQQGDWFIGGAAGYSKGSLNSDTKESKTLVINPSIGTFVSNSLAIGISFGYTKADTETRYYSSDYEFISKNKGRACAISPFVRKYWKISGGFSFFGEASLPVLFGKVESESWVNDYNSYGGYNPDGYNRLETKQLSLGMALAPGFEYRVNNWLSVDAKMSLFNLSYTRMKPDKGEKKTTFSVNGDTQQNEIGDLMVGVKFFF